MEDTGATGAEPTPGSLALLGRFERFAFRFCDLVNRTPLLKRLSHGFLRHVGAGWVHPCVRNLLVVDGLDRLRALAPPRGLLVCANHRTFFDLYVVTCLLFRETRLPRRVYFPVRSDFFYEGAAGLLVNGLMSAWSMYPPIVRQPERSEWNKFALGRLSDLLQAPGTVVGFHPEGTRNKTDDPYTLLPANPGVGQLVAKARPTVLPVFVHGLTNNLGRQVRSNFTRTGRKIIVVFGAPLDLEPFYAMPPRLRTYLELAKHIRGAITDLGTRERTLRGDLEGTAAHSAIG
jgi:1-acyl-sn-glycerol-3-phosphate acyltransferase